MHINKAARLKEVMDAAANFVAHSSYSTECICTRAQMSDRAQELKRSSFLLQRISSRIGKAEDLYRLGFHFGALPLTGRFHNRPNYFYRTADTKFQNLTFIIRQSSFSQNLHTVESRTIV
ncbi:MAG: hypothetical protein BWY75_02608 [bacterium ADurb.Bin425]|nr:MAG: hypothetical protein BWY75_02608 [bacterium ADurb.Bin425]